MSNKPKWIPPHPDEQAHRVANAALEAIGQAFADGHMQGKQPGDWLSRAITHHLAAAKAHLELAIDGTSGDIETLEHIEHALTRLAMAKAKMEEP